MNLKTSTWESIDLHEIAKITFDARQTHAQDGSLTVDRIEERFHNFLSVNPARIISANVGADLIGLLILLIKTPSGLEVNPGQLLGGYPVVVPGHDIEKVADHLIEAAIALAKKEGYTKIESTVPMEGVETAYPACYEAHGFHIRIRYVEMICDLTEHAIIKLSLPEGFEAKPLSQASKDDLYRCYTNAFSAGDAQFFFDQGKQERREYFDSLGYKEAINEPSSVALLKDQQLVGFGFVLPYGKANCHISCMCIEPEFRRRGLGEFLLHNGMNLASQQGYKTITLGTDTRMAAYELYKKNGFTIIDGSVLWLWEVS